MYFTYGPVLKHTLQWYRDFNPLPRAPSSPLPPQCDRFTKSSTPTLLLSPDQQAVLDLRATNFRATFSPSLPNNPSDSFPLSCFYICFSLFFFFLEKEKFIVQTIRSSTCWFCNLSIKDFSSSYSIISKLSLIQIIGLMTNFCRSFFRVFSCIILMDRIKLVGLRF